MYILEGIFSSGKVYRTSSRSTGGFLLRRFLILGSSCVMMIFGGFLKLVVIVLLMARKHFTSSLRVMFFAVAIARTISSIFSSSLYGMFLIISSCLQFWVRGGVCMTGLCGGTWVRLVWGRLCIRGFRVHPAGCFWSARPVAGIINAVLTAFHSSFVC